MRAVARQVVVRRVGEIAVVLEKLYLDLQVADVPVCRDVEVGLLGVCPVWNVYLHRDGGGRVPVDPDVVRQGVVLPRQVARLDRELEVVGVARPRGRVGRVPVVALDRVPLQELEVRGGQCLFPLHLEYRGGVTHENLVAGVVCRDGDLGVGAIGMVGCHRVQVEV